MSIFTNPFNNMMNLYISDDKRKGFPVVFLHGNSINHKVFEGLAALNHSNSLRHILIDLPGHGFSPKLPTYTFGNMAEALCCFINQSLKEDYFIVAHSLSGHLVLNGLPHLERIRGLILIGTPPIKHPADMSVAFHQSPAQLLYKGKWSEPELREISLLYSNTNPEIISKALQQCDQKFKADFLLPAYIEHLTNEHAIIKNIGFPTVISWSSNDVFVSQSYIKALKPALESQKVIFHEFEHGGHSPFLDTPDVFYNYLTGFTASVSGVRTQKYFS